MNTPENLKVRLVSVTSSKKIHSAKNVSRKEKGGQSKQHLDIKITDLDFKTTKNTNLSYKMEYDNDVKRGLNTGQLDQASHINLTENTEHDFQEANQQKTTNGGPIVPKIVFKPIQNKSRFRGSMTERSKNDKKNEYIFNRNENSTKKSSINQSMEKVNTKISKHPQLNYLITERTKYTLNTEEIQPSSSRNYKDEFMFTENLNSEMMATG